MAQVTAWSPTTSVDRMLPHHRDAEITGHLDHVIDVFAVHRPACSAETVLLLMRILAI